MDSPDTAGHQVLVEFRERKDLLVRLDTRVPVEVKVPPVRLVSYRDHEETSDARDASAFPDRRDRSALKEKQVHREHLAHRDLQESKEIKDFKVW
jgi:hypothetical protein